MISISPELDDWIRSEIHELTVDARPLTDVLVAIDTFERRVEKAIVSDEHAADLLSVRQVLARLRLTRALELKGDALRAKELFDRAVALGFSDRDDRAVVAALFSRVCLARGRADFLSDDLEDALTESSKRDPAYQILVEKIRRARRTG